MKVRTFIEHCPMSDVQVEMKQDGCVSGGVSYTLLSTEEEIRGKHLLICLSLSISKIFFEGFFFGIFHWDSSSGDSALGDSSSGDSSLGDSSSEILRGILWETSRGCSGGF